MLYSVHNELVLLHKYRFTKHQRELNKTHVTQSRVIPLELWMDSRVPHWTLSFLLTNYCLTRFPCIFFLLLEYICFSINLLEFPVSFFFASITTIYIYIYIYIYMHF